MSRTCQYCESACADDATKCVSCGAPVGEGAPPDYRFCPFCRKRLLSLGSPACNYCGRHLPEKYIKVREATLRRLREADAAGDIDALDDEGDGALKRALKSLLDLK